MAGLGSLIIKVGADIASFTSDMGRAAKIAEKDGGKMKEHMVGASKAIAAGAAIAGAALTKMVMTAIDDADKMRDMANAIGSSTEALSQLEFAATQSGTTLDAVVKGMAKLQSATVDAGKGMKTQSEAFDRLGLSAKEMMALSPERQFEAMADALKNVTNSSERSALAADIFGQRISVGLMPMLMEGSKGIQQMRARADELGITLSTDMANGADAFNDRMGELSAFMTGFGRQLTTVILPVLLDLFDRYMSLGTAADHARSTGEFLGNVLKSLVSMALILKGVFEGLSKVLVAFGVIVINVFKALISPVTAFVNRVSEAFDELSQGNFKKAAEAMNQMSTDVMRTFDEAANEIVHAAGDLIPEAMGDMKRGVVGAIDVWEDADEVLTEVTVTAKYADRSFLDMGETAKETAEKTKALTAESERLADAFNQMERELDPVAALTKEYDTKLSDLDKMAKAYNWTAEETAKWQRLLNDEFVTAKMAAQGYDTTLEEVVVTAKKMGTVVKEEMTGTDGVAVIMEETFKRLDATFADFWVNMLKNGEFSLKGLKDLFLETLGQMIHAAITQPIVLRIGTMATGGLASGSANAGGSLLGLDGMSTGQSLGVLGAGVGGGLLGNLTAESLFGAGKNQQLGSMIGAAGLGTVGYAFGAVIGGPIGAAVGAAIGAFIGGIVGGFLGSLFDSTKKIRAGGAGAFGGNLTDTRFFDSAFGGVHVGKTKGGMDEHVQEFGEAIAGFDEILAGFMSNAQIEKVTEALKNWEMKLKGESIAVEEMLEGRFSTILSTFGQNVQDYVAGFDGLEAKSEALAKFVTSLNAIGRAIATFVSSDPAALLAEQLAAASLSSTDKLAKFGDSLLDLIATFDGTPEMMDEISIAVDARYRAEMEYLVAIDALIKGISASIAKQQDDIRAAVEGPKSFEELLSIAQAMAGQLGGAGSPEQLAAMVANIQNLVSSAFGGLDAAGQSAQAGFLISFLDQVEAAATARADQLRQMVLDEGVLLREQSQMFAESIGAPLELNVAATDAVNESINRQTDVIVDTAADRDTLLRELIGLIRQGNDLAAIR